MRGGRCLYAGLRVRRERGDQQVLTRIVERRAAVDRLDDLADPVDDAEHRVDERGIGGAFAVAYRGEDVLRRVAQPGEARQVEKAAASLDGVDEAKDRIEAPAIRRCGFPRDDLAGDRLQRFARLGNEFL